MRTYLLLGGAGFLGANLAHALVAAGDRIVVIERDGADLWRLVPMLDRLAIHRVELRDTGRVVEIMDREGVDTVVHLVSTMLPSSGWDEYLRECEQVIVPTLRLVRECAQRSVRFVFYSSGGTVYGNTGGACVPESHPLEPICWYGQGKVLIEEQLRYEHRCAKLPYLVLRPANPYGRFQDPNGRQGFISVAMGRLLNGEPISIWGDGSIVRDFVHIDDLVRAGVALLDGDLPNTAVNVGSGRGTSLLDAIRCMEEATGRTAHIRYGEGRAVDIHAVILDIRKLQSLVPYAPVDLPAGIAAYCRYLKDHHAA